MALSKEEQERIRKRWESRQRGSTETTPVSTGSTVKDSGVSAGASLLSDSDKARIAERWNSRFDIDESFVNDFLDDANKFLTQAKTDYKKLDWNSATSESSINYYKAMQQTENDLSNRAIKIQNYLNVNKGKIDEETYNNLSSYLKNFTSPQFSKLFFDARDYYSQWDSAEAYDTDMREQGYQTKYEGKSYSDILGILANMEDGEEKDWLTSFAPSAIRTEADNKAAERELEQIKHQYMVEIPKQAQEWMDKFRSTSDPALKKQYFEQAKALEEKALDLEQEYGEKEQNLNNAKRMQNWAALASVSQNEDFKENSAYTPTGIDYKNVDQVMFVADYDDLLYEYINNAEARNWLEVNTELRINCSDRNYDEIEPEEVAIYNYHYKINGKEKAQEYLDSIQEVLNERAGKEYGEKIKDIPVARYLFGAVAGLDQFGTGLRNAVEGLFGEKTYIPTSSIQYASQIVRDELGKSGVKLPEWLGGATLGQAAYDVINTGANMAPTILVSTLIGGPAGTVLGTTTLGVSAGGNAYQYALNQGYGKEKALAYGTMIGVSEAVLEKALGGIGALGGTSKAVSGLATKAVSGIDNAILRFSLKYSAQLAGKVGSEALEEGLQSILEPIFQQAILNNDAQIDWEEVAYSALLGGAMGGVFGGVELTAEVKADHKANVSLGKAAMSHENFQAEFQGVLEQALQMPQNSEAYHLAVAAQKKIANGKQLSEAEVGALYRETSMEVVKAEKNAGEKGTELNIQEESTSVNTDPAQQTIPTKLNIDELVDETIAQHTGAPADPVSAAVDAFRQSGTVTNKQATDILNSVKAVQSLVQETGVKLDGLTMSQRRQAVKNAIEQLAQEQVSAESTSATETIEPNGIKEQLRSQQDTLSNMQPAVEIQAPAEFSGMDKAGKQNWVVEKLRPTGYKVDRKGFGIIDFAKKRLKAAFKYFDSGSAEEASFEAIPYVLERGIEISSHEDHKGRNYRTVTIAAPVVINGKRGNMAVVVKQTDGNHYKVHRILTPDGSVFQLSETTNEADRADGGVTETGSLATSNGAASLETGVFGNSEAGHRQTQTLIPVSNNIIRNSSGTVNKKNGAVPSGLDTAPRTDVIPAVDTDLQTEYTYSRSEQVSRIIDRLNNNGENTPTIGEIMALPEIAIAERANEGTKTILLPDREQIQQRAYEAAIQKGSWNGLDYSGEVRQDKRMDIVIGLPGSGKSSVYTERLSMEHKSRVVDTDDFREYIPEYNGINAALVHEEASKIRDRVFASALRGGDNILLSTIGANAEKLADNIRDYKKLGYQVYLHLNELPNNKSLARAIGRYISEDGTLGRYVSPALIADYGDKPTQTYLYLTGQGGNKNGGLESNLRSGRGSSYGNAEETGSRSRTADLLAGYDWYNNDVGKGEAPRLIQSSDKPDSIHEQYRAQVKANAQSANESVGAADKGFSPKYEAIDRYGNIPEGENPARVDQLPRSTNGQDRVSYTARTALEAKVTPDEFAPLIENETMKGGFSFIPLKNTDVVKEAEAAITKTGWEGARANWTADVRAGKSSPQITATGALLYNNAVNSGDYEAAMDILMDYQLSVRNSAQALQAARILKTLSPSDRLYMIQKSVEQMVEDAHLDTDVTIDEALQEEYLHAETDEARDAVIDKIQQHVADQIPSTLMEKWTALRYVNMLGNLRTQIRNIAGNAGMKAVSSIKNTVATAIENIAHKASGGKFRRTKSLTVSKELLNTCRSDFSEVENIIQGGGKYADSRSESTEFARGVKDKQTVFKFKPLEGYRKLTNWAMEQGDLVFSRAAYARALAGYLKANGVTGSDLSSVDSSLLDDARLYAVQEAQEQTFRDTNWLSGWISKVGRRKDTPAAVKVLSEGIMPFRKTPANVLVRAEEYSPLGVINSVVTSIKALQKGSDITGAQVVNSWAKSLTGTGIFGLGMLLQSLGLLSAGPDDDEDKDSFDSMNGWQNYALTLPDGTNLTIDFFTPSAIPLLMGAELMQLMQDGNISVRDIESALTSLAEPMVEMSMLQGVNDTLENVRYSENNLGQMVINSALSYLTQGLTNTLFGQLERTFEDSRMQTFVDKDSPLPDWLQRTLGKASAKTPIWEYNQIPYINAWGEEEENPSTGLNAIYNLLSPSYIDKGVSTELTQELNRLNSVQSDINVYPSTPDKTVTFDKQSYNLSAEEYVALAKLQGKTQKQLVEDLISHEGYASLSDENKARAIRFAYAYARDSARGEVVPDHPGITTKWMAELEGDIAEGILRHVATGTTEKYTGLSIEKASFVAELLDSILPPAGKTAATQLQKVQAITSADSQLSDKEQQQVLQDVLSESAYGKYLEILELGYSNDDYSDSYRIYTQEKETGGKGTKARTIEAFQKEFGISKAAATALYEVYN